MLKYRLLTSLVGVPLIIYIVYLGGWIYYLSILVIILMATYEFFKIGEIRDIRFSLSFSLLLNAIIMILFLRNKWFLIVPLYILFVFISSAYKVLFKDKVDKLLEKVSLEVFSSLYIALPLSYFICIRNLSHGFEFVILLLGTVWLNDSFAYFIGRKWGKNKINVHISPNKTREGAIGGFVGGTFSGLIFGYFFGFDLLMVFLLSLAIIFISQIGDLIESAFKREVGIKDAGTIIPGHGGILDRFDGLIFATPIFYYLILFLFKN